MTDIEVGRHYPQVESVEVALEIGDYRVSEAYLDESSYPVPVVAVNIVRPTWEGGPSRVWIYTDDINGELPAAQQQIVIKPEIEGGQGTAADFTLPRVVIDTALELLPSPIDS